jgi:formate/nitrite transporter
VVDQRFKKSDYFKEHEPPALITASPFEAHSPPEIAKFVAEGGIKKAQMPLVAMISLGILAGIYIAFGGMFYTLIVTDSGLGFGPERLLGGVAFSLGLILVVIGGAELFTGNTMLTMAWAQKTVSTLALLRNWGIIYVANFIGALMMALLVSASGALDMNEGMVAEKTIAISEAKAQLTFTEAFFRGLLCNTLVCLAVWLCFAARSVSSKIMAILFPISAFVALGFEHSVANMYLIPVGMIQGAAVSIPDFLHNLIPVTLGNIVGGGVFVALFYWLVYLKRS